MSISSLPTPTEISERLVRDKTLVTLDTFQGFAIVAFRNGHAQGFGVAVEAQDPGGLGTRTHLAIRGFERLPSREALADAVQQAHRYIERHTADAVLSAVKLRPYVEPLPSEVAVADQELLAYLCREDQPANCQHLSLDRLLANPRFDAVGGSLERLEAAGAIKAWGPGVTGACWP